MMTWFKDLAPREQVILATGCVLVLAYISWVFVWNPLVNNSDTLRQSVQSNSRLVVDLRRGAAIETGSGFVAVPGGSQSSLLVVTNQTAQTAGLVIESSSILSNDEIRVLFRNSPFDTLATWLSTLSSQYGVSVAMADISSTGSPGMVNAQLVLERG